MTLDVASFLAGLLVAAALAGAWECSRQRATRLCRRIVRHGRSLDQVFFEDTERDPTVKRPEPVSAAAPETRENVVWHSQR